MTALFFFRAARFSLLVMMASRSSPLIGVELRVAEIFGDHMVLQRDVPVRIWGTADPGETVNVRFALVESSAVSDPDGRWVVTLPAMPANSEGRTLRVARAGAQREFKDVLVGDVWLCSGQSNMEFKVERSERPADAKPNPLIRHFGVSRRSYHDNGGLVGAWQEAEVELLQKFTAVGYFFASKLQPAVGVPIGLINSSWGGTRIESWLGEHTLRHTPCLISARERWEKSLPAYAAASKKYAAELAQWPGAPAPKPKEPVPPSLNDAMITPLVPFSIKGVLWYQGEANASYPEEYRPLFTALVAEWRARWSSPAMPFLTVQLPAFGVPWDKTGILWAYFREAQEQARKLPGVHMAVSIDLGDDADIHPVRKKEVGRRLAQVALREIYHQTVVAYGPRLLDWKISGAEVVLSFDQSIELVAGATEGKGFELAGENKQFLSAHALIKGNEVTLIADGLSTPVEVRYGWSDRHTGNLQNKQGLPAEPFRTDMWPRY